MQVVPQTWVFRLKPLENVGVSFLHKARCVVRGDKQETFIDFNPDEICAPVASHEAIRLILAYAASENLLLEGADISNAYLYGNLDVPIYMTQHTNASSIQSQKDFVCLLKTSMYGLKQAGEIWGSLLYRVYISFGFTVSSLDVRVFFLQLHENVITLAVVVDDIKFASNSLGMLTHLKE